MIAAACLALTAVSACTVRPLYSEAALAPGVSAGPVAGLSSVAIKPVTTRFGQEVRNQLIFLLNGGAGQPAAPLYYLDLGVTSATSSAAVVQRAEENEPTSGAVTVTASYVLTDVKTGDIVARGRRDITSSFDRPRQEFAAYRAERDAQNRAARELAELLRLAIAQDLERAQRR